MTNQPSNTDPKPEGPGDDAQQPGYTPPQYGAPSTGSGADAPAGGGYTPPQYGAPDQGYSAPSGNNPPSGGGYTPPQYGAPTTGSGTDAPTGGGYTPPQYGAPPSTPDQTFGQTPSYGAPGQQPAQPPYGGPQAGYDPNAGQTYGAPQGGYDPTGAQPPYGAAPGGYGAPTPYGAPGGYRPNPYAQAGPQLATWGRRAIGGLIDFVVPAIVVNVLISVLFRDGGAVASLLDFVLIIGYWVFNTGYRVATTGYSFGHKIGKVRVVMADTGQTPTTNTAILRAVCHLLDSWACAIGWLFPLWDAKKQTFADKIGKTVVLDEQNR